MRFRSAKMLLSALALTVLCNAFFAGCAHRLGPKNEPTRVARELGFAKCDVSEPMRRYQALDFADLLGDPNLANSHQWAQATAMMQPGDHLRYVYCKNNGDNFFGLFRGKSLLMKFGGVIED